MADYMEVWLEGVDEGFDESWFSKESYYNTIREVLSEEYSNLRPEQINILLENVLSRMSPEEAEGFWDTLKDLGKKIGGVAAQVLPVAAPILGTAFAGPLGGAFGGTLGQLAGQFLGGGAPAPQKPLGGLLSPAQVQKLLTGFTTPAAAPTGVQPQIPAGGSSATAQLMSFLQNPAFLQSILGLALGSAGRSSVPVGKQGIQAPVGAFLNALSFLANQAAIEANVRGAQESAQETLYLGPEYDPAVPEQRALGLLRRLNEGYFSEANDEGVDDLTEWFVKSGLVEVTNPSYSRRR